MTKNEILYKQAEEAIRKLFGDTDVDVETTIRNLNTLKEEIYVMLDSLE